MEKLIKLWLPQAICMVGKLYNHQHGLREGHVTISAIHQVIEAVNIADRACHADKPLVLLVRNYFNSVL